MKRAPNEYRIQPGKTYGAGLTIIQVADGGPIMSPDGEYWYPARPEGLHSFGSRIRLAWAVFTGKADALRWPAGQ